MREPPFIDWRAKSRCRKLTPVQYDDLFFPNSGRSIKKAKEFCLGCPVRENCLEFALSTEAVGIWAGTTKKERIGILKFRARVNKVKITATKSARKTKKRNLVFT